MFIICLINNGCVHPSCLTRFLPSDQDKILIFHEEQNYSFLHGQITGVICSHTLMQFQLETPEASELTQIVGWKAGCLLRWVGCGRTWGVGGLCTNPTQCGQKPHPIHKAVHGAFPKYTDKNDSFSRKSLNIFHLKWNYLDSCLKQKLLG